MENGKAGADLRMRGATVLDVDALPGTIHPFMSTNKSLIHTFTKELQLVLSDKQGKKIGLYILANLLCTVLLLIWCNSTNSMALTAYTYMTIFDVFSLTSCLVTIWVQRQKPTPIFSLGYERFEVLAVFASTILAQLGALFITKESIERVVEQPEIHTGRLLVGTMLAFCFHMGVTYAIENKAFTHVIAASGSSWLQEHVADISESICHLVPGLSKLLLPRINPFALIAFGGAFALMGVYVLIDVNNYYATDTWAAVWIGLMTIGTMFPMSVYTGKILLQTNPAHIIGQLDKCLREASTLDGVLEFRNEHFWTIGFGTMGGSVHVRVRRDADEQMVLAHVVNRLSSLVSMLTVQIFKDDWTRSSAYQILGDTSLMSKYPLSGHSYRVPMGNAEVNAILNKSPPISPTQTLPYPNLGIRSPNSSPYGTLASPTGPKSPTLGISQNVINLNSSRPGFYGDPIMSPQGSSLGGQSLVGPNMGSTVKNPSLSTQHVNTSTPQKPLGTSGVFAMADLGAQSDNRPTIGFRKV